MGTFYDSTKLLVLGFVWMEQMWRHIYIYILRVTSVHAIKDSCHAVWSFNDALNAAVQPFRASTQFG